MISWPNHEWNNMPMWQRERSRYYVGVRSRNPKNSSSTCHIVDVKFIQSVHTGSDVQHTTFLAHQQWPCLVAQWLGCFPGGLADNFVGRLFFLQAFLTWESLFQLFSPLINGRLPLSWPGESFMAMVPLECSHQPLRQGVYTCIWSSFCCTGWFSWCF